MIDETGGFLALERVVLVFLFLYLLLGVLLSEPSSVKLVNEKFLPRLHQKTQNFSLIILSENRIGGLAGTTRRRRSG